MLQEAAGAADDFGAKLTPIHSRRDFEQLIKGDKPVVVDFMAPWCGKCRMIAPFVDELSEKYPDMVSLVDIWMCINHFSLLCLLWLALAPAGLVSDSRAFGVCQCKDVTCSIVAIHSRCSLQWHGTQDPNRYEKSTDLKAPSVA